MSDPKVPLPELDRNPDVVPRAEYVALAQDSDDATRSDENDCADAGRGDDSTLTVAIATPTHRGTGEVLCSDECGSCPW